MLSRFLQPVFLAGAIILPFLSASRSLAVGVKSVGSVEKGSVTQIAVVFDAPVDPASAGTAANYTLAGAQVQSATVNTDLPAADATGNADHPPVNGRVVDNQSVTLVVNGTLSGSQTLTIKNVKASDGATMPDTVKNFTPSGYKWAEVGAPLKPSLVLPIGTDGFDIYSNGRQMWNVYDEGVQVYKEEAGDFDIKVRVEFQDTSSRWARTGVAMRQALNEGEAQPIQTGDPTAEPPVDGTASKLMNVRANPALAFSDTAAGIIAGNNQFESVYRDSTAANYTGGGVGVPGYPTAWTRIQRTGAGVVTSYSNDGQTWEETLNLTEGWDGPYFVGPSYFPEINNINDANGADVKSRRFLAQFRFTDITIPLIKNVQPTPSGFAFEILDAATATLVPASVKCTWNGVVVPVTPSPNDLTPITYTIGYASSTIYPVGAAQTLIVEFKDSNNLTSVKTFNLVVQPYNVIPATYSVGSATTRGINALVNQMGVNRGPGDANSTANAEQQFNGGFIDPSTDQPYPNVSSDVNVVKVDVVNTLDNGTLDGNFPDGTPTPGIPGVLGDPGNFVAQYYGYIELKKGSYRMGVNSDDGFKLTVYSGGPDSFGIKLGEFNGGRGSADSIFDLVVDVDGVYPFRLLYWQGAGAAGDNANCEWFSVDVNTGKKILINDPSNAAALKTFTTATGGAYVKSLVPYPGSAGNPIKTQFKAVLANGATTIDTASIALKIDNAVVTPTVTGPTGGEVTVSYIPATDYAYGSAHTGELSYKVTGQADARVIPLNFAIKGFSPAELPANSFWIEIEDYNHDSGQTVADASVMPYAGGGYDGLPATYDVDYHNTDINDSDTYRPDTAPINSNISSETTGRYTLARPGDFEMAFNYKIGWIASGDWFNYTRTIPAGIYTAFLATSIDVTTENALRARLQKVTSDPSKPGQTLELVGTFNGPGSGGWSQNDLVPMKGADGGIGIIKIKGTAPTTLRVEGESGDLDWLVLSPVDGVPPKVTTASPANGSTVTRNAAVVNVKLTDHSSAVVQSSVQVLFDGANVTAQSGITKVDDVTTVTYNPGLLDGNSTHTYRVQYTDDKGAVGQFDAQFSVNILGSTGQFLIEAEDFNSGGQAQAIANTMPYTGNAYANLPGTPNVDYASDGPTGVTPDGMVYRAPLTPLMPINVNSAYVDRGTWTMTVNYKIGWADANDWCDYTRSFPAGTYEVWAALSEGSVPPNPVSATLFQVTSDPTLPNQTTQKLGSFSGAGTGGWGVNQLFPMNTDQGQRATVSLSGTQTLRFQMGVGDFDYFMLVPSSGAPTVPTLNANFAGGNIVITYTGVLEFSSGNLSGPYNPVQNATSPYTVSGAAAVGQGYYRSRN